MTTTTTLKGRLGNQFIRNLCVSIIAEKQDLFVVYSSEEQIRKLGLKLHCGTKTFKNTTCLHDDNYFDHVNMPSLSLKSNLDPNSHFFQTSEISNYLINYLKTDSIKGGVIDSNPHKSRYNQNKDCFVHVRLGDIAAHSRNLDFDFYKMAIDRISFEKLFIASDDLNHPIIKRLQIEYPQATCIDFNPIGTIQFGSTNKFIILSHGSFSAMIGFLAFFFHVYSPRCTRASKKWFGDMVSPSWIEI